MGFKAQKGVTAHVLKTTIDISHGFEISEEALFYKGISSSLKFYKPLLSFLAPSKFATKIFMGLHPLVGGSNGPRFSPLRGDRKYAMPLLFQVKRKNLTL